MDLGLVERDQDGWIVLTVSGEIDIATARHDGDESVQLPRRFFHRAD